MTDTISPRTSSQVPVTNERSQTRRQLPLDEQFNAPIRTHVWKSKRQWTRQELDKERQEFFDTRVTGHAEIWATLKIVVGLLADSDTTTAQSILDAAAITVPTGDLVNGVYDEAGNLYQMPAYILSDPQNLVPAQQVAGKGEISDGIIIEDEDLERKREEKGKSVLKADDIIMVKARLSDRGGPDVIIAHGKDQPVRVLSQRIREDTDVRTSVHTPFRGQANC